MVFSYCLKMFLVTTNNFWSFSGYSLIYLLFDSNTFAWKTQWKHLHVLGDLPGEVSVQSCHYFYGNYEMQSFWLELTFLFSY